MAVDERNFRSTYYEKVGFKSVEEKKSLEILLKDKTLDRIKLKQFCLRYSVPVIYRNLVWKVLLDIIPVQTECHQFVMEQRQQECRDVIQALQAMRVVDINTSKPQLLYAMWLLQTGCLHHNISLQKENGFILIAHSLQQFSDDDTDLYWLAKCFYAYVQRFTPDVPKLVEATLNLLEKEDSALFKHLTNTGILSKLPLNRWFDSCLAGLLNENALGRIWDKLCGGSCKILVFVIVVLLTNQRHKLLKCTTLENAVQCVSNLPEETAEIIANKAIEMWQQHGSPLTVHDKPKPS
ncbi:hypothetical protein ILUMI_23173 [Ignelater luminosus]|uniref:TBC1 domain family member 7 n=1 Tax=Ignelater luminosus TaxID=2038154 RepID=A0A8K0CBD7_IGNLU|nr:hypothetical protein ILUMI_23173 [Ignelater luminosus]